MPSGDNFSEDSMRVYRLFLEAHKENFTFVPIEEAQITPSTVELNLGLRGMMLFRQYSCNHNQALVDSLRQFSYDVSCLNGWQIALDKMSFEEKSLALLNHLDSLIPHVVGYPYSIKEQFCESIGVLSTIIASSIDGSDIKAGVSEVIDCHYKKERLAFSLAINCEEWRHLKISLGKMDSKKFRESTDYLRNRFQHSFTRNLIVGLSGQVTLLDNGFSYGTTQPIQVHELIDALVEQRDYAFYVYEAYIEYAKHLWSKCYIKPPSIDHE